MRVCPDHTTHHTGVEPSQDQNDSACPPCLLPAALVRSGRSAYWALWWNIGFVAALPLSDYLTSTNWLGGSTMLTAERGEPHTACPPPQSSHNSSVTRSMASTLWRHSGAILQRVQRPVRRTERIPIAFLQFLDLDCGGALGRPPGTGHLYARVATGVQHDLAQPS